MPRVKRARDDVVDGDDPQAVMEQARRSRELATAFESHPNVFVTDFGVFDGCVAIVDATDTKTRTVNVTVVAGPGDVWAAVVSDGTELRTHMGTAESTETQVAAAVSAMVT